MDKRNVALFVLLMALLLGQGVALFQTIAALETGQVAVRHGADIATESAEALSSLKDVETGQRGYLLSSNNTYLEPYQAAVVETERHLLRLNELVNGDADLLGLRDQIGKGVAALKAGAEQTVQAMSSAGAEAARALILNNQGKETMDGLRRLLSDIESRQSRRLGVLRSDMNVTTSNARTTVLMTTFAVLIIGGVFYLDARRSQVARAALVLQAETALAKEADARAETERVGRVKDEFLATLSHELRNPLNAMLSWATLMRTGKMDPPTLQRGLETIERNARSQAQLIDDLLDMSRIVSGKMRLDMAEVDLYPLVGSAVDVVRPAADAKGVAVGTEIDQRAGPISGDPERIRQILWNLLSNALKFTPKGGRIDVHLVRGNSQVSLRVSDTGQGIDPGFLPHVFDRFRQADSSATRSHGGLGLGLGIAKHLVELQGGTIGVESEGKGLGTAFTVNFPVRAVRTGSARSLTPASSSRAAAGAQISGLRILAIDDQLDTLDMLRTVLSTHGAFVETATSVDSGLVLFERWRPDLVVADIGMPEKDGYALISTIRALPERQGGRTPAVALTAFVRVEDRIRALASGYQMHLAKPIEPDELIIVVASLAHRLATPAVHTI
jgi:signal transduction histidine kinase/CheY-like chemotaxis protein